jgi:hypothetical protein
LDRRYPKLAGTIPDVFPNYKDLEYYFTPLTNFSVNSRHNGGLPSAHYEIESSQPCLAALTTFCEQHFGLEHEGLITRLCTTVWEGAALRHMCKVNASCQHFFPTDQCIIGQLPKQLRDPTVYRQPMIKPISRWVTSTMAPAPKLNVIKLRFEARQFADIVRSALSASGGSKNKDSMYFTIPACVVEYYVTASHDVAEVSQLTLWSGVIDPVQSRCKPMVVKHKHGRKLVPHTTSCPLQVNLRSILQPWLI